MITGRTIILLLLTAILICGCSDGEDETPEKGSIKAMTEEIGHEAVRNIQAPIDAAQTAADRENNRIRELEDRLDK